MRKKASRRRRRTYRNPSFGGLKGLDLQGAALIVGGMALSSFIVSKLPIADGKVRALATMASGLLMNMLPLGPMKSKLALGAQVRGIYMLGQEVAPQFFADGPTIVPFESLEAGAIDSFSIEPDTSGSWAWS